MFSFTEKVFYKSYSHFRISAIFGEFGVIFWRILQEVNQWGCYLIYGDCKKCFLLQIKCFPKVIAISQFQPFSGNLGLFFAIFARSKSVGMLFNLRGLVKMFCFIEECFPKVVAISKPL